MMCQSHDYTHIFKQEEGRAVHERDLAVRMYIKATTDELDVHVVK